MNRYFKHYTESEYSSGDNLVNLRIENEKSARLVMYF